MIRVRYRIRVSFGVRVQDMIASTTEIMKRNLLLPFHGLLFPVRSRVLFYAPSHRQDSTYLDLCYTSHGALAGTRNSSMGPPCGIDLKTLRTYIKFFSN